MGLTQLIYSPLRGFTARVNEEALLALQRNSSDINDGLLREVADRIQRPAKYPSRPNSKTPSPSKIVIMPTRQCNMRCVYCDFAADQAHSDTLDPIQACHLIDYVVQNLKRNKSKLLHIHFFGGEPFLHRSIVDLIVHYARQNCLRNNVKLRLEVTTNGKLNRPYAKFVGNVFDTAVVSYDGSQAFQNANRPNPDGSGSFEQVSRTLKVLSETPVELCVRLCATDRSIHALPDLARQITEVYNIDKLNIEPLTTNTRADSADLLPPDPYEFFQAFMGAYYQAHRKGVEVINGLTNIRQISWSSCPVGKDSLMLMPDGTLTACYLEAERWHKHGLDNEVGYVSKDGKIKIDTTNLERIRSMVWHKSRCERCFCRWTCAGGCHISLTPPDCSADYTDECIRTRLISATFLLATVADRATVDAWLNNKLAQRVFAEQNEDRLLNPDENRL